MLLRHLPLSLRERYLFAIAPVDPDDAPVTSALLTFAAAYCHRRALYPIMLSTTLLFVLSPITLCYASLPYNRLSLNPPHISWFALNVHNVTGYALP